MKREMRRRDREVTDVNTITDILDNSRIVHIAMIDGVEPYMVTMNYGYKMEHGKLTLYVHSANAGRKLDVLKGNPKVFVEMECNMQIVEGEPACRYGMAYASLMGSGTAVFLEEPEAKMAALSNLMKVQTGKDFEFNETMASAVTVIRIDIAEYTAKARPFPAEMTGKNSRDIRTGEGNDRE